ncbi:UNVERIFIED_CONTAM: hypothetical protein Sangu_0227800 [Sesamum angustifolium]|uniref:Uncharacterized protein n=1 Tax=Sesamum angustifolium TaxID=2727405 RepID=A0AAW2RN17_9LAMI
MEKTIDREPVFDYINPIPADPHTQTATASPRSTTSSMYHAISHDTLAYDFQYARATVDDEGRTACKAGATLKFCLERSIYGELLPSLSLPQTIVLHRAKRNDWHCFSYERENEALLRTGGLPSEGENAKQLFESPCRLASSSVIDTTTVPHTILKDMATPVPLRHILKSKPGSPQLCYAWRRKIAESAPPTGIPKHVQLVC